MTPKERSLSILSKSEKIEVPLSEEHNTRLQSWLGGADGCTWENPINKIERRQFETSLKCCFAEFDKELIKYHFENPPTFQGKPKGHIVGGLHTMDDQGFEGQVMSDGSFYRWINDIKELEQKPTMDQVADNFTLDEACKIATCDKCKKTFDIDYYGDIVDHMGVNCN